MLSLSIPRQIKFVGDLLFNSLIPHYTKFEMQTQERKNLREKRLH